MAEPEEPVAADNTQRVAPKRLECSCTFSKVNTQAEPKSGYHVGTLESGNTKVPGASALGAQSAPATNFVEEKDGAARVLQKAWRGASAAWAEALAAKLMYMNYKENWSAEKIAALWRGHVQVSDCVVRFVACCLLQRCSSLCFTVHCSQTQCPASSYFFLSSFCGTVPPLFTSAKKPASTSRPKEQSVRKTDGKTRARSFKKRSEQPWRVLHSNSRGL